MAKNSRVWVSGPIKESPAEISEYRKQQISEEAEIIVNEFKTKYLEEKPIDNDFNYRANIYSRWFRGYFYFCSTYNCPSPEIPASSFEFEFVRLTFFNEENCSLAYKRHTGKWQEVYEGLTVAEALLTIRDERIFHP